MSKTLSPKEELLVELVHLLAFGDADEMGLNLEEVKRLLLRPINAKNGLNSLECLDQEGRDFLEELKSYLK